MTSMVTSIKIHCKFCYSVNVIRYGSRKNVQCFWCKDCKRKFANNHALPNMKVALDIAGPAVGSFFEGVPVHTIIQEISEKYRICISDASFFGWVVKFSYLASKVYKNQHPEVGDIWIVKITRVIICHEEYYFVDTIDSDTQFVIAVVFFTQFNNDEFIQLIKSIQDQVRKIPQKLILGNNSILDCIKSEDIISPQNNAIILDEEKYYKLTEHLDDYLQKRNRILSRLKRKENINKIVDGWMMHYNYHRKNVFLNGKTPSQKANVTFNPYIIPSLD
jgi:hypothetical protein